ncbi:methyltransferase domain-containing protein [Halalkalibaculum sp. DA3122]|uniref:methyltransferase domain-containing protein n=1 Tax=unclassified Halalkalibaculum TaxID=2964617 RepID=UPI003754E713
MPLYLKERDLHTQERMDDPLCDRDTLFNTYRQFRLINRLVSRWKSIYKKYIRPYALSHGRSCSILDIGFGGGDIPITLARWCANDNITPRIVAIETDDRAFEFVRELNAPDTVSFRLASSTAMAARKVRYDFVISNHLLHHLEANQVRTVLHEARILCRHRVLFNDIKRSDIGYLLFNLLSRPLFRNSFITEDGLTSIKRSYTHKELEKSVPEGWQVHSLFPYRLLLTYEHE